MDERIRRRRCGGEHSLAGRYRLLLLGIGTGSFSGFCVLSAAASSGRRLLRPRLLQEIDVCARLGLAGFGGVLGSRTLRG